MDRAFLNKLNGEKRIDPEPTLRMLRAVQKDLATSDVVPKIENLRTHSLKPDKELREACLFSFGMSQRIGHKVWVYPIEDADFDFVAAWEVGDTRHVAPVQLKEVVPRGLNQHATVQHVIDKLVKYPVSPKLAVAIHMNQQTSFDPSTFRIPALSIRELWFFGSMSEDQSRWFLYGSALESNAVLTTFQHPD